MKLDVISALLKSSYRIDSGGMVTNTNTGRILKFHKIRDMSAITLWLEGKYVTLYKKQLARFYNNNWKLCPICGSPTQNDRCSICETKLEFCRKKIKSLV